MTPDWLRMRIQEEQERRKREETTLSRLPPAMDELHDLLEACVGAYTTTFGEDSAELIRQPGRIKVTAREPQNGHWKPVSQVEVLAVPELPGIRIDRGEDSLAVEIGILSNDKLFYRDCEKDTYLSLEDLTRRILDRALFPKLKE